MNNRSFVNISSQQALKQQLTAISHNLANTGTTGFKSRVMAFKDHLLEREGFEGLSFVVPQGVRYNFSQGGLETTNNPLDCALSGPGFFTVTLPNGQQSYTRCGQFQLNQQGQLILPSGELVTDATGAPIAIPELTKVVRITSQGDVQADAGIVGRLGVVEFADLTSLQEITNGLFTSTDAPIVATKTHVIQSALEKSNVSPIMELTSLIETHRAFDMEIRSRNREEERMTQSLEILGKTT